MKTKNQIREAVLLALTDFYRHENCASQMLRITPEGEVTTTGVASPSYSMDETLFETYLDNRNVHEFWTGVMREGLTEGQREHIKQNGWDTMYQEDSHNPEDWEEFSFDDLTFEESFGGEADRIMEKYAEFTLDFQRNG